MTNDETMQRLRDKFDDMGYEAKYNPTAKSYYLTEESLNAIIQALAAEIEPLQRIVDNVQMIATLKSAGIYIDPVSGKRLVNEAEIERAEVSALDLLYWQCKELNGQSVDMKFVEAYNLVMNDVKSKTEGENDE